MNRLRSAPLPVQLRDALNSGLDVLPDAELIDRFARYADHPAFEVIVRRHGPMVFGVCRRVLGNSADADDAFQAAFLVLIRKARSLRRGDRLGPWLYGVACRVALKARSQAARRAAFRAEAADMIPDPAEPAEIPDWLPVLDAELAALPAKYRDPLLLCELQGATRADAAKSLGVPEGTLSSRLARGRDLLRKRLLKHGTLLPAGGLPALFATSTAGRATVPSALLSRTSELAKAATGAAPVGAVPVGAARLTDEVLKSMFLTKLRLASVPLALVALAIGLSTAALPSDAPDAQKGAKAAPVAKAPERKMPTPAAPRLSVVEFADKGTVLSDREALQGLWVLEKVDLGKAVRPDEVNQGKELIGKMQFLVTGDIWWEMIAGKSGVTVPLRVQLDPTKNPKWIDLNEPNRDGVQRAIYELDGARLRLCTVNGGDRTRPAEFNTDGDAPLLVMEFRREKLPPPAGDKALLGSWASELTAVQEEINGPWKYTLGQRVEVLDGYLFLFSSEKGREREWIGGKYTVDPTKNPKWIDVELASPLDDGKVTKLYGCYEVADGRLKLALGAKRATRPLEFAEGPNALYFDLKPATTDVVGRSEVPAPKPKAAAKP